MTSRIKRKANTLGGAAELPSRIELPSPVELAKIAAALVHNDESRDSILFPDSAIKDAVRLYLGAVLFCDKHQNDSLSKLADAAGDTSLSLKASVSEAVQQRFRLEVDKRIDPARRFLAKNGLRLGTARAVLQNLKDRLKFDTCFHVIRLRGQLPKINDGMTKKEQDQALEQQALELGIDFGDWENRVWQDVIQNLREKRADGREVYLLTEMMLTSLVAWKKARKRSGGLRSFKGKEK
jgi:hypothetical protein